MEVRNWLQPNDSPLSLLVKATFEKLDLVFWVSLG